jgi:formylglycine-generating enzyme required for sulfatase activity
MTAVIVPIKLGCLSWNWSRSCTLSAVKLRKKFIAVLFLFAVLAPACISGKQRESDSAQWRQIQAGSFLMGSMQYDPCCLANERPHSVTLTHDFLIMTTEVTQDQFQRLMGYNFSKNMAGPNFPVESLSWGEAAAFCNALSNKFGLTPCYVCQGAPPQVSCELASAFAGKNQYDCTGARLPTEVEWEFACRAETATALYSGGLTNCKSGPNADRIGWYINNSNGVSHPVRGREPNAWGLYDMAGNVWEWTGDWYQNTLNDETDPIGAPQGDNKVIRGGSILDLAASLRSGMRGYTPPETRDNETGFRCVRTYPNFH